VWPPNTAVAIDQLASDDMVLSMNTGKQQVNEDIRILHNDVHRLREDLAGLLRSAKSCSKDTVMETGNRIRGIMTDLGSKAKERLSDKSEALKDRGHEAVETWRGGIEHRPMTSLLIAFAAGAVFAFFVSRRRYL
jgi:ElaB/YqjD/DUF883 family membrane-anchored ribosome-binding protein